MACDPWTAIAEATAADAPDLAVLHGACFRDGWSASAFERFLADAGCSAWRAGRRDSEALAGFVMVRAAADEAEILTLAVAEDLRRRGLGAALVEQAAACLGRGATGRLLLEVGQDNLAARGLYAACGFRTVGSRDGYYREGGEDALIMERQLGAED